MAPLFHYTIVNLAVVRIAPHTKRLFETQANTSIYNSNAEIFARNSRKFIIFFIFIYSFVYLLVLFELIQYTNTDEGTRTHTHSHSHIDNGDDVNTIYLIDFKAVKSFIDFRIESHSLQKHELNCF